MRCFQKNAEWATCREDCKPGPHYNEKPYSNEPWTCKLLTFGCAPAFKQCGGKHWHGEPCCLWGCHCNRSNELFHQCVPNDKKKYYCNSPKENQEERSKDDSADDSEGDSEEDESEDDSEEQSTEHLGDDELDDIKAVLEAFGDREIGADDGVRHSLRPQTAVVPCILIAVASAALVLKVWGQHTFRHQPVLEVYSDSELASF